MSDGLWRWAASIRRKRSSVLIARLCTDKLNASVPARTDFGTDFGRGQQTGKNTAEMKSEETAEEDGGD